MKEMRLVILNRLLAIVVDRWSCFSTFACLRQVWWWGHLEVWSFNFFNVEEVVRASFCILWGSRRVGVGLLVLCGEVEGCLRVLCIGGCGHGKEVEKRVWVYLFYSYFYLHQFNIPGIVRW